jgi:hypothetical protein
MRRSDNYECTLCGAIVDVPADTKPKVTTASDEPTMRVLRFAGKEIHRCRKTTPAGDQFLRPPSLAAESAGKRAPMNG